MTKFGDATRHLCLLRPPPLGRRTWPPLPPSRLGLALPRGSRGGKLRLGAALSHAEVLRCVQNRWGN